MEILVDCSKENLHVLVKVHEMTNVEGATSQITHLEKVGPTFLSLTFLIRFSLPQS